MDLSDGAQTSSMLPPNPVQPRETRRYTKEEWETQRPIIVQKYHIKGTTLRMIADYLSEERGFSATERQMKRKVADWQLDKNVKGHEMKSIVRKQARLKPKGKTAAFRVRGQPVPQQKIERWERRSGTSQVSLIMQPFAISPCPTTPTLSVVSYDTISERGPLSPFVPPTMLDTNQGHNVLTIGPAHPSEDRAVPFYGYEEHIDLEHSGGLPPSGVPTNIDAESPFAGESPALFTAPPSPAPSWMDTPPRDSLSASSNPSMGQRAKEPTDGLLRPSTSTALLPPILRHVPAESEIIALPSRTRYLQKEENEHRNRLHKFLHQWGPQHPATLDTLFRLGNILDNQGRFRAAEVAFREVTKRSQNTYGASHWRTIEANTRLLRILLKQGRVRTAVQLARECYAIASSSLHRTHRILLESKLFLADALRYAGQLTESEAFYRDVLQMAGSTFAPDDAFMLVCWANFASFLERQGNFDEMEKTMRAVVLATSLTVGIEATNVLGFGGRYMLSRCLLRKGKYLECETESRQVLTAQKKLLGRDHPETMDTQELLTRVLIAENRYVEGEKMTKDGIEGLVRVLGPHHDKTLHAEFNLVEILLRQSRYSEAEILGTKVIARSEKHSRVADIIEQVMMLVGRIYLAQGRVEDCRVMIQRAVDSAITHWGEDSPIAKGFIRESTRYLQDMGQMDAEELILKWVIDWRPY